MNNVEFNAFSIKEFCRRNGLGRTTVYSEIKAGRLRPKKVGRRTLISREEEQRWFAQDGERHHD
jgi:excisionase family DNA binding protein